VAGPARGPAAGWNLLLRRGGRQAPLSSESLPRTRSPAVAVTRPTGARRGDWRHGGGKTLCLDAFLGEPEGLPGRPI